MPKGFFPASVWNTGTKAPGLLVPKCGACGLLKTCQSPKMPVDGEGRRSILIVGEAPGATEDEQNRPFIGKAGQYLDAALDSLGVDLRRDCWITNALICRPPGNRTPTPKEIEYCRPNLLRTIRELQPLVIITLGRPAMESLIGHVWKESPGPISRWVGWVIPCAEPHAWVCPSYHPSYLLRERNEVLDRLFLGHLEAALLKADAGKEPPKFSLAQVEVLTDPTEAATRLRSFIERGGEVATDYECNATKPEAPGAEIISNAVCWEGRETISYPMRGEAIAATWELLQSERLGKIGQNIKFEERWTRRKSGRGVRPWVWDTMLAAHVLDNRQGVVGLKFQAFVELGVEAYDEALAEFMRARGGDGAARRLNLIEQEVDLRQLLGYGGIDALVTYEIAQRQRRRLGK